MPDSPTGPAPTPGKPVWSESGRVPTTAEVIQRNPVEQHMPVETMPQRVGSDTAALGDLASLSGLSITG